MAVKMDTPFPTEKLVIEPSQPGELLFTRAMLDFLEESGLIEGRFELIGGRIISKMRQNSPHSITISECFAYLLGVFPRRTVRCQATVEVWQGDRVRNRPEPDVFVLREAVYQGAPPANDLLLIIEVCDTTQGYDLGDKVKLYAEAGVAEYWVIDLPARTLTVFRTPDADAGTWASRNTLAETQTVAPESAPGALIKITDLLTPVI